MNLLKKMEKTISAFAVVFLLGLNTSTSQAADMSYGADNFYTSDKVISQKVKFNNIYCMEVVGTLFTPKQIDNNEKHPALIVGHPFAAVRQQSADLYATKMAEVGFITLTFDQSFWG